MPANNIIPNEGDLILGYDLVMAEQRYEDTIGGRLFLARKNKGYTLEYVGGIVDVRQSHLSGVENNKVGISLELILKLVDLYGVDPNWVLNRGQLPPEPDAPGITEEAESAAKVIDSVRSVWQRRRILEVVALLVNQAQREVNDLQEAGGQREGAPIVTAEGAIDTRFADSLANGGSPNQAGEQPKRQTKRQAPRR